MRWRWCRQILCSTDGMFTLDLCLPSNQSLCVYLGLPTLVSLIEVLAGRCCIEQEGNRFLTAFRCLRYLRRRSTEVLQEQLQELLQMARHNNEPTIRILMLGAKGVGKNGLESRVRDPVNNKARSEL